MGERGVAGLFTQEFYHRVRQALAKDGVFIQWLHLYENNAHIIASVERALMEVFSDYRIYLSGSTDVIFIVTPEGKVPDLRDDIFAVPEAREILAAYRFRNADDMDFLFLGDSTRMHPYFASFNSPANSDYFPFLENNAPRAFFLKQFYPLPGTLLIPVALYETLYGRQPPSMSADEMMMSVPSSDLLISATEARKLAAGLDEAGSDYSERLALLGIGKCAREPKEKLLYFNRIINVLKHMMPFWSAEESRQRMGETGKNPLCIGFAGRRTVLWHTFAPVASQWLAGRCRRHSPDGRAVTARQSQFHTGSVYGTICHGRTLPAAELGRGGAVSCPDVEHNSDHKACCYYAHSQCSGKSPPRKSSARRSQHELTSLLSAVGRTAPPARRLGCASCNCTGRS